MFSTETVTPGYFFLIARSMDKEERQQQQETREEQLERFNNSLIYA